MSVTAAKGFVASGVAAGIRRRDRKDLAIVRSLPPAIGAAMFTRNRVQAACLRSPASTSRSPTRRRS